MFWVEIKYGEITGKGESPALADGQIEVTKGIYNQLTYLPATFETDTEGNIISVTPAPETEPQPQPPSIEERLKAVEDALLSLL